MIHQVFKKLVIAFLLLMAGCLAGVAWCRLPALNPEPKLCQEKINLYGEVKSCPVGMRLEVAGNNDIAYVICRCVTSTAPKETLPLAPELLDNEEPLGVVPVPVPKGTRL